MATKYNTIQYTSDDLSTEEIVISKEHWLQYEQLSIANWQIWKSQKLFKTTLWRKRDFEIKHYYGSLEVP